MNTFNLNIFLFMALCGSASLPVEKRALPISCGTGNIYMIFLLFFFAAAAPALLPAAILL